MIKSYIPVVLGRLNLNSHNSEPKALKPVGIVDLTPQNFSYLLPMLDDRQLAKHPEDVNNFVKNVARRLIKEDKILVEGEDVFFNTCLRDKTGEYIYALGKLLGNSYIKLKKVFSASSACGVYAIDKFNAVPQPIDFSNDPLTSFNTKAEVKANLDHILIDNFSRHPDSLKKLLGFEEGIESDFQKDEIRKYLPFLTRLFWGSY